MLLDCRDKSHKMFPVYNENLVFLVVNSNVKHALQDSPYAERQNSCFTAAKIMGCKSLREATLEMLKGILYFKTIYIINRIQQRIE